MKNCPQCSCPVQESDLRCPRCFKILQECTKCTGQCLKCFLTKEKA